MVVTADAFRFIVTEQMASLGIKTGAVLIESVGRDTAPAVLAAALHLAATDPDGLMLVAPSDHVIPDGDAFNATVVAAVPAALAGQLVTFGIRPDRAETGYGYLEMANAPTGEATPQPLKAFVEKPDATTAAAMLAEGRYLWNAGIFLFSVKTIVTAFHTFAPDMVKAVQAAIDGAQSDLGFTRLDPAAWDGAQAISIDYAVMEKADNLSVVPFTGRWSDLGDWTAVWRETQTNGISLSGPATAIDCTNTLLR